MQLLQGVSSAEEKGRGKRAVLRRSVIEVKADRNQSPVGPETRVWRGTGGHCQGASSSNMLVDHAGARARNRANRMTSMGRLTG